MMTAINLAIVLLLLIIAILIFFGKPLKIELTTNQSTLNQNFTEIMNKQEPYPVPTPEGFAKATMSEADQKEFDKLYENYEDPVQTIMNMLYETTLGGEKDERKQ